MLLLLICWCYLGFTFLNLGFAFQKITKIKSDDHILTLIFGMFLTTILASIWAIYGRIHFEFQVLLIALQSLVLLKFKKELYRVYQLFWRQIKNLPKALKVFLITTVFLVLINAVSNSTLIDNETYYIQTIKWLNEFGFVKGLVNLHPFFGQTSGWHILQSAFSFSYLPFSNNDLNGFCLLLGNLFGTFRLHDYFKNGHRVHLWFGLLPLANAFLFSLSNVPSPDLAVAVLSMVLFYYFIKNENDEAVTFNVLMLLTLFIIYIKITALPLVLLPFLFFAIHFKKMTAKISMSLAIGLLVLILFAIKNTILTGLPLFPSLLFQNVVAVDYALPMALYNFSFETSKCYSFFISGHAYAASNGFHIFLKWLTHSYFNGFVVILLIVIPYFIKRFFNSKAAWMLYAVMVFQFIFIWYTSPQFRFMIPFISLFCLLLLSLIIRVEKTIYTALFGSFFLIGLLLIFPPKVGQHHTKIKFTSDSFSSHQLLYPNPNSNLKTTFEAKTIGNLHYFSPDSTTYIWATGDGKLPCVNEKQLQYFKKQLGIFPQCRTNNIKDGFYSKNKSSHD